VLALDCNFLVFAVSISRVPGAAGVGWMKRHGLETVQHARPVVQPGSGQDRREARLADLRRSGGRVPGGGSPRRVPPPPLPLPAGMTAAPRLHSPTARPALHQLGVLWPRPLGGAPPLLRRRLQRAASSAALSPAGSLADETLSLPASPTMANPADAAGSIEAQAEPHAAFAREEAGRTADSASGSSDVQDAEAASDGEDDGAAVSACKALLYAAANAVLFGVARLLHGTFTSY